MAGVVIPIMANAQSPGTVVGTTYMDMQTLGSTGNRVAVFEDGGVFFTWTNQPTSSSLPRQVYFNFIDSAGVWFSPGIGDRIFDDFMTGYSQVTADSGDHAVVAAYATDGNYSILGSNYGYGIFGIYNVPDSLSGNKHSLWPYITIDRSNRVHVVMTETMSYDYSRRLCYARAVLDSGNWWPNQRTPQVLDTVCAVSAVVASSPVSDKVVIAYCRPADINNVMNGDIYYILSQDGITWDFENSKVNITNYNSDTDSLWAYIDLDVIFDYDDNFHIIWNAGWSSTEHPFYDRTYLFHYGSLQSCINQICAPWPDSSWTSGCDYGIGNRSICKMNMGVRPFDNRLYAVWTQFDTSDCSVAGYANGDIWIASSSDGGIEWGNPQNLTNSHTPGCFPGNCDSDNWASLADVVDSRLHLFYLNDKDAGSALQYEGSATQNPMLYFPVTVGIGEEAVKPAKFELGQNYPNPFNANTSINFELKQTAKVKLEIFNVSGQKITTLINQRLQSGQHRICWNAEADMSGVYYYKITADGESQTKKMVLIK
jgi:hypothetical protein